MSVQTQLPHPGPDSANSDLQMETPPEKNGLKDTDREIAGGGSVDLKHEITGARLLILHTGLCLCTLLVGLDFNLIATAVPAITSDFSSIGDVGWYGAAFYIALCATQPLAGKTFTLFSKQATYLCYVALFEIGSLPAWSLGHFRGRLGDLDNGHTIAQTCGLDTHDELHLRRCEHRGSSDWGALTQHVTWRWCFYLNLPIGGFSAAVVLFFCKVKRAPTENGPLIQKLKSLDGIGFALFAGSVAMLLLALMWGGTTYAWNSSVIIGLFVGSGVVLPVFVAWQLFIPETALIPPRLFTNRNVVLIFASAFFSNGPFQTIVYWLPIWFQAVLGVTPTASGVRYLPTVVSDVLASLIGTGIVMKLGTWNPFLIVGTAMVALGAGLLTTIYPGITDGHWIGYQIFGGIGYSLIVNMAHLGVQASLPPDLVPIGATTLLFVITASCAVFLAVGQAVFQERLLSNLAQVVPADVTNAVISVGATHVRTVVSTQDLARVLRAYSDAITQVFYVPAAAPVISFLLVCGTKWISTRKPEPEKSVKEGDIAPEV